MSRLCCVFPKLKLLKMPQVHLRSSVVLGLFISALGTAMQPANALLEISIVQGGTNINVSGKGSLDLSNFTQISTSSRLDPNSLLFGSLATIATSASNVGIDGTIWNGFQSFPADFGGGLFLTGTNQSGDPFFVTGNTNPQFILPNTYTSGDLISFSFIIANRTLAGTGDSSTPPLQDGNYQWLSTNGQDSIDVCIGTACPQVPVPLPVLGAAAAFGYSRKLRNRIASARAAQPSR